MTQENEQEKDLAPSSYKLEQARKKGNVAKSPEVASAVAVGVASVAAYTLSARAVSQLEHLQRSFIGEMQQPELNAQRASKLLSQVCLDAIAVGAPLIFLLVCMVIVGNLIQTGPVFATEPLKPDFARINLSNGFKRIFSLKTIFDLIKNTVKFTVVSCALWFALKGALPGLQKALFGSATNYLPLFSQLCGGLLFKLFFSLLLIAIADFVFTRWDYLRKLRMSHKEQKDEHKQREGDPRIKRRMRELQREMLKRSQALKGVKDSSVIVTNPTRIAVAIRYDAKLDSAPRVIAKGAGQMARQIRLLGGKHRIPVVHSPSLARSLYRHTDFGNYVPDEWHPILAKILVWVSRNSSAAATAKH